MSECILDYLEPEDGVDEHEYQTSVEITKHTGESGGESYFLAIDSGVGFGIETQSIEITKELKEKLIEALDKVDL